MIVLVYIQRRHKLFPCFDSLREIGGWLDGNIFVGVVREILRVAQNDSLATTGGPIGSTKICLRR